MRKSIILFIFLSFIFQVQAWQLFGPENIVATNICFAGMPNAGVMICTDDGMYLYSASNNQWDYHSESGLPVIEGIFLETETILLVMGNGSYSDGIYNFDVNLGQFIVIEYCLEPTFIKYDPLASKYYVGHSGGLLVSDDGISWEEASYFSGKNCLDLAMDYTNLVISVNELPPNVYWSNNSGDNWQNGSSFSPIYRMTSYYGEHFFGMCPLNTVISGFYSSEDGGNSWDPEFLSNNISDISYDQNGFLLVTWHNPGSEYEGIAVYEPGTGISGLTFLNDGLPSTNIFRVKQREGIDVHFAYVCTDIGVYHYVFVGIEQTDQIEGLSIFPNPIENNEFLILKLEERIYIKSIQLLNLSGEFFYEKLTEQTIDKVSIPISELSAGVYLVNVISQTVTKSSKIVVK